MVDFVEAVEMVEAAPCTTCGTTGGAPHHGPPNVPGRCSGARFGVDGNICIQCYNRLYARARRAARQARAGEFGPEDAALYLRQAFGRVAVVRSLSPAEVRRRALAIHSELAASGDAIENRRIRSIERGPHPSPAEGARAARREYWSSSVGRSLRPVYVDALAWRALRASPAGDGDPQR